MTAHTHEGTNYSNCSRNSGFSTSLFLLLDFCKDITRQYGLLQKGKMHPLLAIQVDSHKPFFYMQ